MNFMVWIVVARHNMADIEVDGTKVEGVYLVKD